jgi:hypothetical protein
MRTNEEIINYIDELNNGIENVRNNMGKWKDQKVPIDLIRENLTRIHTLEWVLGEHDRFD